MTRPIYPFSAIVGQDELKLALIISAIDPPSAVRWLSATAEQSSIPEPCRCSISEGVCVGRVG